MISQKKLPNILITGTPGTGKTTFAKILEAKINESIQKIGNYKMSHIELSRTIQDNKLYSEIDEENDCTIFDEDMVIDFLEPYIPNGGYIVDFHGSNFFPERYFDFVFVLRTNNTVLYERLKARNYSDKKITNNIDCEIFQICKNEAFESYSEKIIYEFSNNKEEDMNNNINQCFEIFKNHGTFSHLLNN